MLVEHAIDMGLDIGRKDLVALLMGSVGSSVHRHCNVSRLYFGCLIGRSWMDGSCLHSMPLSLVTSRRTLGLFTVFVALFASQAYHGQMSLLLRADKCYSNE